MVQMSVSAQRSGQRAALAMDASPTQPMLSIDYVLIGI